MTSFFFPPREPNLCRVPFPLSDWQWNIGGERSRFIHGTQLLRNDLLLFHKSEKQMSNYTHVISCAQSHLRTSHSAVYVCFNQFTFVFNAAPRFSSDSYQSTWYESQTQTSVFGHIRPNETAKYLVLEIRILSGLVQPCTQLPSGQTGLETPLHICVLKKKKRQKTNHLLLKSLYYYHPLRATRLGFDLTFVFNKYAAFLFYPNRIYWGFCVVT